MSEFIITTSPGSAPTSRAPLSRKSSWYGTRASGPRSAPSTASRAQSSSSCVDQPARPPWASGPSELPHEVDQRLAVGPAGISNRPRKRASGSSRSSALRILGPRRAGRSRRLTERLLRSARGTRAPFRRAGAPASSAVEVGDRLDQRARASPRRAGTGSPSRAPLGSAPISRSEVAQRVGVVHQGVDDRTCRGSLAGDRVGHGAQVGPRVEAVLDPADRSGKRRRRRARRRRAASATARAPRRRSPSRCASARLGGHPDQPRQPVLRHPLPAEHVPGWTKTAAPSSCAASKTGKRAGSSRFQPLTCVPICTPANPSSRTQRSSSQIASSGACSGSVPSPTNRAGRARDHAGDVVVEQTRQVERVLGLRPVAEHHRHGRQHLHADAVAVALLQAARAVPAVVRDLAEQRAVDHHPRAPRARGGPAGRTPP